MTNKNKILAHAGHAAFAVLMCLGFYAGVTALLPDAPLAGRMLIVSVLLVVTGGMLR